jgi:hypothetical protein
MPVQRAACEVEGLAPGVAQVAWGQHLQGTLLRATHHRHAAGTKSGDVHSNPIAGAMATC